MIHLQVVRCSASKVRKLLLAGSSIQVWMSVCPQVPAKLREKILLVQSISPGPSSGDKFVKTFAKQKVVQSLVASKQLHKKPARKVAVVRQ